MAARADGRTVAGVVAVPIHRETFSATLGGGALLARRGGPDRPIRCASPATLSRAVVATGFGYDPGRRQRQAEVVARVIPHIADIRRFGAAAVDLCWVGCGRVDGYWEVGLNDWDHAAGALIAAEAGAVVSGLRGGPAATAFTLAASPAIAEELRAVLRDADAAAV
jgi:myo-inositol-1(or 4)-monophosphatase